MEDQNKHESNPKNHEINDQKNIETKNIENNTKNQISKNEITNTNFIEKNIVESQKQLENKSYFEKTNENSEKVIEKTKEIFSNSKNPEINFKETTNTLEQAILSKVTEAKTIVDKPKDTSATYKEFLLKNKPKTIAKGLTKNIYLFLILILDDSEVLPNSNNATIPRKFRLF